MTAFLDTFTGGATTLAGHTSDSGNTWAIFTGDDTLAVSATTPPTIYQSASTTNLAFYKTNFTPSGTDCDFWLEVECKTFPNLMAYSAFLSATGSTGAGKGGYHVQLAVATDGTSSWSANRVVSNSFGSMGGGGAGPTFTANTPKYMRVTRRSGVLRALVDGVSAFTWTDGSPLSSGAIGLGAYSTTTLAPTTGMQALKMQGSDPLTATVSGPSSGSVSAESTAFTVTLSQTSVGPTVVTLASNGSGDVFHATSGGSTVTSTTVADGATTATFYLVPGTTGARTITPTVPDCVFSPTTLTYTSNSSGATTYTLTGPGSGYKNNASTNFTVTPNGNYTGTVTITPSGGGLSTPVVKTFSGTSTPQTFTITPTATGTVTLTPTNSGSLTNPSNLSYTSNAQTLAAAPATLSTSATTTVTFTGGGTLWNSSAPTFTPTGVSGVSVGTVTVVNDTSATAPVTTGTATGTVTFTDSTTSATATAAVATTRVLTAVAPYGSAYTGQSIGYTIYNTDGTTYQAHTTTGVAEVGATGIYAVPVTVPTTLNALIVFDAPSGLDPYVREVEPAPSVTLGTTQSFNNTGQTANLPANVQQVNGSTTAATKMGLLSDSPLAGAVSADASPTTTTFTANTTGSPGLSTTAGFYSTPNSLLVFTSGTLKGKTAKVTGYAVAGAVGTFTVGTLPVAPTAADTFEILSLG